MEGLNRLEQLKLKPSQVLVLGFGILIFIGATLLNLPIACKDGMSIGFINALFTSASAVCVTGLVVVNTMEHWTLFGQIIILLLIQIGGLGFMTMATLVSLLLGRKITLKDRLIMQEERNSFSLQGLVKLTQYVIKSTLLVEFVGVVLLATAFVPDFGLPKGLWFSLFHSISAFCNAGFDLIGNSFVDYVGHPVVMLTLSALIIIGGLGYFVYIDITKNRLEWRKYNLHTKMVLTISAFLLLVGFLLVFIIEFSNPDTFGNLNFIEKFFAAIFQGVVPRTAGFNSIDMALVRPATAFVIMLLMFVGGSPGSTAGGVKTTTVGAIVVAIWAVIKGNKDVEVYNRQIPLSQVFRALAVTGIAFTLVIIVTIVLSITEQGTFLDILFESVSAFGTVGLSRGLTPSLTAVGRLIITATMFIGRLGPLTMAFAFARKGKENRGNYHYAEEKIIVG
jgi:trk system potassium uptake protein TrkH